MLSSLSTARLLILLHWIHKTVYMLVFCFRCNVCVLCLIVFVFQTVSDTIVDNDSFMEDGYTVKVSYDSLNVCRPSLNCMNPQLGHAVCQLGKFTSLVCNGIKRCNVITFCQFLWLWGYNYACVTKHGLHTSLNKE